MDLLEREDFLETLADYAGSAGGGDGRLVLIAGEAGVGKSALVEALRGRLEPARWLTGACDGSHTPQPLGPLFDIASEVGGAFGEASRSGSQRDVLFRLLLDELSGVDRLTVVVVEDAHWADESTLDLLRFLGRRVATRNVLLLVTYRDDGLARGHRLRGVVGELARRSSTRRISLPPLSRHAVEALARTAGLDPAELFALTGGNPFFVTEMLRAPAATVPTTAREVVLARVAGLSAEARDVLEAAAVIGARAEADVLRRVAGGSLEAVDECLTAGALESAGHAFRFRHEIARQAVEAEIPAHRLGDLHRRVLDTLVADRCRDDARLAHHAEGARDRDAVLRFAVAAGRQATELAAHREAATQYERALRYADGLEQRRLAELWGALATENALLDRWEQAEPARRTALALWRELGDDLRVGDTLRLLARNLWRLCRAEEAEQVASSALEVLERLEPSTELAWAYAQQAGLWMQSRAEDSASAARRAQDLARALDAPEVLSDALNTEGCAMVNLDQDGSDHLRCALEVALSIGAAEQAGRAYTNLQAIFTSRCDWEQADRYFTEGLAYVEEHDIPTYATCLRSGQAWALESRGLWSAAEAQCQELLTRADLSPLNRLCTSVPLARIMVRRGDPRAQALIAELLDLAADSGEWPYLAELALAAMEHAWLHDDQPAAREAAGRVQNLIAASDATVRGSFAVWLRRCGLAAPDLEPDEAYALQLSGDAAAAATIWRRRGCPYLAGLALVDAGDEASWREALAVFQQLGATATVARTQQLMRESGIAVIPRGPHTSTRANAFGLTRREQEVLDLLAEALTNAEIAAKLTLAEKTVDHHVSAILRKLDVPSRRAAVRRVTESVTQEQAVTATG